MSRWREQIAPVLEALGKADHHSLRERGLFLGYGDAAKEVLKLDLDDRAIHEALLLLKDLNYVAFTEQPEGPGGIFIQDLEVCGKGQQALGGWPRFEMLITPSTLAALLDMMAEQAESDEERGIFKRAADYVRTLPVAMLQQAGLTASIQLARALAGLP